jgi:hypothetical protein
MNTGLAIFLAIAAPGIAAVAGYLGKRLGASTEREKNQQEHTRWASDRKAVELVEARALAHAVLNDIDQILRLTPPKSVDGGHYRREMMGNLENSVNRLTVAAPAEVVLKAQAMQLLLTNQNAPPLECQKGRDEVVAAMRSFSEAPD